MSQSGSYNTSGGGGGSPITTLTGNTGGAVSPSAGNINVVGTGSISVTGNPGTHTLTISSSGGGGGITTLNGDTGSATGSTVTIAGGTNVTTSATGSTVTINASGGGGLVWSEITTSTVSMAVGHGYILNNAGGVTATLPATAVVGDLIEIVGKGSGGWTMAQNSGQTIHFVGSSTTTGTGGSVTNNSGERYDSVSLICITANTDFVIKSAVGNLVLA